MKLTILCSVLYFERRLVWFLRRQNISKCPREDKCIEQGISLALKWPVCVCNVESCMRGTILWVIKMQVGT